MAKWSGWRPHWGLQVNLGLLWPYSTKESSEGCRMAGKRDASITEIPYWGNGIQREAEGREPDIKIKDERSPVYGSIHRYDSLGEYCSQYEESFQRWPLEGVRGQLTHRNSKAYRSIFGSQRYIIKCTRCLSVFASHKLDLLFAG
jgi:hypothetical protein